MRGDGNGSQSSSGFPCPEEDNGEGDNGEDEAPCTCENNEGGSSSSSAHGVRGSSTLYGSSAAGRRVVARTLKTEMVWRTNFGSFRGMTGLPQGLLDIVGYTFSSELWSPRALHYWHPMTHEIISAPLSGIGANTAFQIRSGELTLITTATRMEEVAGLTVLPPLRDPPSAEGLRGSGGGPLLQ